MVKPQAVCHFSLACINKVSLFRGNCGLLFVILFTLCFTIFVMTLWSFFTFKVRTHQRKTCLFVCICDWCATIARNADCRKDLRIYLT